ncbi:site-specific integrase [Blastomonas sp. AAP53]|uniref:tyrosine-type recombinase/integrase n=1 Tax=Blastomonas sp. AAP53 TaxID=1248760 RepID=UPI000317EAC4|nr:site-specific integrase [Blastomonas sp. AAP53]
MQLPPLTDLRIRSLQNTTGKREEHRDAAEKGLYLVIQPSGAKSFVWRSKSNGRKMRVGIGSYPAVTLAEARSKVRELARNKSRGIDPVAQRKAARQAARVQYQLEREQLSKPAEERGDSFLALANEWLRRVHDEPLRRQAAETRRYVEKYLQSFHGKVAGTVSRQEVVALVSNIERINGATTAHHALKTIKAIYNWAIERGWSGGGTIIERNPADKLRTPRSPRQSARTRRLSDAEIAAFWAACDAETGSYGKAYQLLLLSSQRLMEVLGARWSEFDLDQKIWLIPADRMKMAREHAVPLTQPMLALLESLPRIDGCDHLFPNRRSLARNMGSDSRAKLRISARMRKSLGEVPPWVFHDFRRTSATELQRQGFRGEVIEAVQSRDAVTGTAAHYNLYAFSEEKRKALEAWNNHVASLIGRNKPNS